MEPDKHAGEGGSFEMKDGERVVIATPGAPHPEGDRPRHADGTPIDKPADHVEPALPAPARGPDRKGA